MSLLFLISRNLGGSGGTVQPPPDPPPTGSEVRNGFTYSAITEVTPSQTIYLSMALGDAGTADLSIGSTTYGADRTAAIQSVLNNAGTTATALNPVRVVNDGRYAITGIRIPSNVQFYQLPTFGLILLPFSNKAIISNTDRSFASFTNQNITIDGGILNGNGWIDQTTANQAIADVSEGTMNGIVFEGVDGFIIRNVEIRNTRVYAVSIGRSRKGRGGNIKIHQFYNGTVAPPINSDGFHVIGNCSDFFFDGIEVRCGDDGLAFTSDDLWGTTGAVGTYYGYAATGVIENMLFKNLSLLEGGRDGLRLLSGTTRLHNVFIEGVTGTTEGKWGVIDNYIPSILNNGVGNMGTVHIKDVNVTVLGNSNQGGYGCVVSCSIESLTFENVTRSQINAASTVRVQTNGNLDSTKNIQLIKFINYQSNDVGGEIITDHLAVLDVRVTRFEILNSTVNRTNIPNDSALLTVKGAGQVEMLYLRNATTTGVKSPFQNVQAAAAGGYIREVDANGITHNVRGAASNPTFSLDATVLNMWNVNYTGDSATVYTTGKVTNYYTTSPS